MKAKKSADQSKALEDAINLMRVASKLLKEAGEPSLSMKASTIISQSEAAQTLTAVTSTYGR